MKSERIINVVDSHTAGEPTRVVLSGMPKIYGKKMAEKRDYFKENYDSLRKMIVREPRGHRDMVAAVIVNPCSDQADAGILFLDSLGYLDMCGHGTIGATTVLLETGIVEIKKPETTLLLDTPAGLVKVRAKIENNSVENVTLRNVPSFLYKENFELQLQSGKVIKVDIAFGGDWYIFVSSKELSIAIRPEVINELIKEEKAIREAAKQQVKLKHPDPSIQPIFNGTMIYDKPSNPRADAKEVVIFGQSSVDRSPCGTGTCARMASLYSKGKLELNETFVHESIIGSIFEGRLLEETRVGNHVAVKPEITGAAYITGFQQLIVDPNDPFKEGFII